MNNFAICIYDINYSKINDCGFISIENFKENIIGITTMLWYFIYHDKRDQIRRTKSVGIVALCISTLLNFV